MELPLPMSASSSSSSSQPLFDWPRSQRDPFDTFDPASSSSEDDPSLHNIHRTVDHRSITDSSLQDGQPVGIEFTAGSPMNGYNFTRPPSFNRTFSSPLPSRLGYLRHPLPTSHHGQVTKKSSFVTSLPPTPLTSISTELADSLQSAIQTLIHLSPPHLLDNAKELYSACTVQIPATSLSALMTSMKSINFLSAHAEQLFEPEGYENASFSRKDDFDVGELLQRVADMLSGEAAEKRIDFVLFHGDVDMKHVSVNGNGEEIAYVLGHILSVAKYDDTIELGLQILPQEPSSIPAANPSVTGLGTNQQTVNVPEPESQPPSFSSKSLPHIKQGPLLCIFEIIHNIFQSAPESASTTPKAEFNPFTRLAEETEATRPHLETLFLRRMLAGLGATLKLDVQPSSLVGTGMPRRTYELSILLPRGNPIVEPTPLTVEEEAARQPFSSFKLPREPTLVELSQFAHSLRGKKISLYANLNSIFARHLTKYLAAWGMNISHIQNNGDEAFEDMGKSFSRHDSGCGGLVGTATSSVETSSGSMPPVTTIPSHFIVIDDDIDILRRELVRLRSGLGLSLKPRLNKRPTLSGRTRSSPSVRLMTLKPLSTVLIHFTSLTKYNQVQDIISSFLGMPPSSTGLDGYVQPEVMVIPKPIGPRRFLTALYTAVQQPLVDPFFSPIATSPRSPGNRQFAGGLRTPSERETGFFDSVIEEPHEEAVFQSIDQRGVQKVKSPLGEFPPSAAQIIRTDHDLHFSLPTPGEIVATPAQEYFSSTSKSPSGGSSAASGVVMQSPDGRPFGMFFEPPVKHERQGSGHRIPSDSIRRKPSSRRASANNELTTTAAPHQPRRSSAISTTSIEERRSSIGNNTTSERPVQLRLNSRKKSLPATEEPIIAIGRARGRVRSETITLNGGGSRRVTPTSTPPVMEEKQSERGERNNVKKGLIAPSPISPPGKKGKQMDVVVPPINVLIVEDNPINQNILSMFLRKKKIKNQSAKDGAEAVEKWRTGGFHLILMDIQLPVMDGIAATKEIRRLERYNNIGVFPSTPAGEQPRGPLATDSPAPSSPFRSSVIIVALTASSLQSDRVAALAAGCNDFLTKPVSLKWLDKKIVEWGCMQALIDFDGWKRWKSSDIKDRSETRQGFSLGPQQAAKSIANRLKIERKNSHSPAQAPQVNVQSPTPDNQEVLSETTSEALKSGPHSMLEPMLSPKLLSTSVDEMLEPSKASLELARTKEEASEAEAKPSISDSNGSPDAVTGATFGDKPLPPLPSGSS
ncbi:uncharacterized protein L203_101974 [Cryptococcus depauperatus CBS 7841]|uniref:Response regulatory domain-containing protein n=1 Tax=Cryptococcus depauperatus CBS 7841 TaxID=1295531 RepID=A0AAJ8JR32_9TREE